MHTIPLGPDARPLHRLPRLPPHRVSHHPTSPPHRAARPASRDAALCNAAPSSRPAGATRLIAQPCRRRLTAGLPAGAAPAVACLPSAWSWAIGGMFFSRHELTTRVVLAQHRLGAYTLLARQLRGAANAPLPQAPPLPGPPSSPPRHETQHRAGPAPVTRIAPGCSESLRVFAPATAAAKRSQRKAQRRRAAIP